MTREEREVCMDESSRLKGVKMGEVKDGGMEEEDEKERRPGGALDTQMHTPLASVCQFVSSLLCIYLA